ncbi:hypothetical protein [Mycobacterium kyorinense]|nr:hypothetical protein [Mycobacterium kyorinense]
MTTYEGGLPFAGPSGRASWSVPYPGSWTSRWPASAMSAAFQSLVAW